MGSGVWHLGVASAACTCAGTCRRQLQALPAAQPHQHWLGGKVDAAEARQGRHLSGSCLPVGAQHPAVGAGVCIQLHQPGAAAAAAGGGGGQHQAPEQRCIQLLGCLRVYGRRLPRLLLLLLLLEEALPGAPAPLLLLLLLLVLLLLAVGLLLLLVAGGEGVGAAAAAAAARPVCQRLIGLLHPQPPLLGRLAGVLQGQAGAEL